MATVSSWVLDRFITIEAMRVAGFRKDPFAAHGSAVLKANIPINHIARHVDLRD